MATAKKTTKQVEKAVKATEKKVELAAMSVADLEKHIAEKRADQLTLAKSHKSGELVNPRALTHIRKDIARALTALTAKKEEK